MKTNIHRCTTRILVAYLTTSLYFGSVSNAFAQEQQSPSANRVNFTATAETEAENDVLMATLFSEERGKNTAELAEKVNQAISQGLDHAKNYTDVESRSLNYTTNPHYDDGNIVGWRVRQEIQLKSQNSNQLSELLGKLQETLNVQSIQYTLSPEQRKTIEDQLTLEALDNFKKKANMITRGMGKNNYKMINMHISNSSANIQPPYMARAEMSYAASSTRTQPTLQAGKQKLIINIQAEIELSHDAEKE
jgi:predicted secreted protein